MSLELRVQHLEELVVELRRQVSELQARLDETRSPTSSFDLVPPSTGVGSQAPLESRQPTGSGLGASSASPRPASSVPLTAWHPYPAAQVPSESQASASPVPLTAWNPNPAPPVPNRSSVAISASERAAACRERGLFLRRALDGQHRGASGRDRLPLQSRFWIVARDFGGNPLVPVRVCRSFADCARLCKQGSDLGDSVCVGLPARQDIIAVCSAAGLALPDSW